MSKPNKTVGNWLRKNPRDVPDNPARRDPELFAIMDKVQRGEMTPAEGAKAVEQYQQQRKG